MSDIKVCVPIRAKTISEALSVLKKVEKTSANIVELWADAFSNEEVATFIARAKRPVLVVCKAKKEKGSFVGSEKLRVEKLIHAVNFGARYVDVGLHTSPAFINKLSAACKKSGTELVISHHEWTQTPQLKKLLSIAQKAHTRGADIIKIATFIRKWSDAVILFELTKILTEKGRKVVVVGMGPKSYFARLGGVILGGQWTYAALDMKNTTAAGQPMVQEMRELHTA